MKVRPAVYDTYWKSAAERQAIFFKKLNGSQPPYTVDPIFRHYKFCNVYRASDRVSQYLIKEVIYQETHDPINTLFRVFLFRLLNKPATWELLEQKVGQISLNNFSFDRYSQALTEIKATTTIYGNAFILCANKSFGYDLKHQNHLALLKLVFTNSKIAGGLLRAKSLRELFTRLTELPLIGNFMAYQLAIDFNYSPIFNFDEDDFTVAGPGAIRGIKKCFIDTGQKSDEYIIKYMVNRQGREFARLGLNFKRLGGRALHAIDCQNWFCETDKYSRVKFPELVSNRTRIKTAYTPRSDKISYFYPPKWGIILT